VLEDYFKSYDFICLSETKINPLVTDIEVNGFKLFYKQIGNNNAHTTALLVKESLIESVHVINDVVSTNVLWLYVNKDVIGYAFVLGAIYVPHEGSPIFNKDVYDIMTQDVISFNNRFNNCPVCLVGDFNSRTGIYTDFIGEFNVDINADRFYDNELLISKCKLESCGFDTDRYNQDPVLNNNGRRLLDFCKINDIHIVNGRFGQDYKIGQTTCKGASVVDYVIASPGILGSVTDFQIDDFDPLLSDIHSPICVTLSNRTCDNNYSEPVKENKSNINVNMGSKSVKWQNNLADEYKNNIDINSIIELSNDLDKYNTGTVSAEVINSINDRIQQILLSPAEKLNMVKKAGNGKSKNKNNKPWFNEECKKIKAEYMKIKKKFKMFKSTVTKNEMKSKGKELRQVCRKNKRLYERNLHCKLKCMKNKNPKDYWNILNFKKKDTVGSNISLESFTEHFKKLSEATEEAVNIINVEQDVNNEVDVNNEGDVEQDVNNVGYVNNEESDVEQEVNNECVNDPVTIDEVLKVCKSLKNNKACGNDLIVNEFIKNCPREFYVLMTKFFNMILNSGHVPNEWCIGLILPLYKKKGSVDDPNNYRGITLLSCMSKVFTSILNERLRQFLEKNNKLGQEQAGYRAGYSTVDHIYAINTLIEMYLSKGKRLYCVFVDYQKAFDLIDRSKLWQKILAIGVNGKVFKIIQNMYNNARSSIKHESVKSQESFKCNIGVRQGENLSPLLFSLYLNDFEDSLSKCYKGLKFINNEMETMLKLYLLLYADDTVILAEDAKDLQYALNGLYNYCREWNLTVNLSKTKVVVFSRGKVKKIPVFKIGNSIIDFTYDYEYLGCTLNYNGKFKKAIDERVSQAKRAMFNLLSKMYKMNLPIDITCHLFDSLVTPVLLYCCEVWGYEKIDSIENLHVKFCKIILKLNKSTANCMALGELGRLKLRSLVDKRIVSFWTKIVHGEQTKISCKLYRISRTLYETGVYNPKWIVHVKQILDNCGLSYLWDTAPDALNPKWVKSILNLKIDDRAKQEWYSEVNENSKCINYRIFKNEFGFERYLTQLYGKKRILLTKFRCGNSKLPVITGRYAGIIRNERLCTMCNNSIGDEYHYILECPAMRTKRALFLKPYYCKNHNTQKLHQLFNTSSKIQLGALSTFISEIETLF
jgi:hypothetical protein